jgi:hypothetical protein
MDPCANLPSRPSSRGIAMSASYRIRASARTSRRTSTSSPSTPRRSPPLSPAPTTPSPGRWTRSGSTRVSRERDGLAARSADQDHQDDQRRPGGHHQRVHRDQHPGCRHRQPRPALRPPATPGGDRGAADQPSRPDREPPAAPVGQIPHLTAPPITITRPAARRSGTALQRSDISHISAECHRAVSDCDHA